MYPTPTIAVDIRSKRINRRFDKLNKFSFLNHSSYGLFLSLGIDFVICRWTYFLSSSSDITSNTNTLNKQMFHPDTSVGCP